MANVASCRKHGNARRKTTATGLRDADPAVKVKNAACTKCGGAIWFSRSAWLHCRGLCSIRFTIANPTRS